MEARKEYCVVAYCHICNTSKSWDAGYKEGQYNNDLRTVVEYNQAVPWRSTHALMHRSRRES